jgi:glycosyltransferase 2 family protein
LLILALGFPRQICCANALRSAIVRHHDQVYLGKRIAISQGALYRVTTQSGLRAALSSSMNKAILRTFQAVFTIAILIWLFHSPQKRALMADTIGKADRTWLIIGLPVALIGEVANIIRWQILMRVQGMIMSWRRAIMLFFVGLFFNLFMPGYTGGDFARLYYLMREFPDKRKEAILTVVMDRLIGVAALVVTAVLTTVIRWQWLQRTPQATVLLWVLISMLIGFAITMAGSFIISGFHLLRRLPHRFPLRDRLLETSEAYQLFARSKSSLLYAFLLSFPVLFSFYGAFYCTAKALGAGVSLFDMCSIMPIVTSIISLPITPSGIGFRESLLEILLHDLCGVPNQIGVLISLLGFAYFVLFGVAGGITYLFYAPKQHSKWRVMEDEVRRAHHYSD